MTAMRALAQRLFDAFVAAIEPAFARFVSSTRLVAVVDADDIALHEISKGRQTLVARSSRVDERQSRLLRRARGGAVELRLRPDQILHRTLRLPRAGRDFLEPIIENRLERLTPWKPEKVLFGFEVVGDADPDGTISVEIAATSEDIVAEPVLRLRDFGLVPTALGSAAEPIATPLRVDLYRGRRGATRSRVRRAAVLALSAAALVLVPACLASFWLAYSGGERLRSVDARLLKARALLQSSTGAGEARGRDRALIEAKRPETSVLVLIDRLSTALPATTYLRELEIDPEKVRLVGFSADASALIGRLETGQVLAKARFAAPVTRDAERRDSFDIIAARLAPQPEGGR